MAKKNPDIEKHFLIPKHSICNEKEKEAVLKKYNSTISEMPKILIKDAALASLKAKVGDMIKIEREDELTGKTNFYRVVAND